ncbi:hypothetical protein PVAR5_4696 [Paecilomyces variotii No. 5]|uniref:AB hydrolase-1 domain-containing protein n=1 Tax=Byssochlamys spectabilis (strain No. 5 / NBRC 109023) TaxID=1356009 RepID=V5G5B3_BYSSN|nr:hypothetical protein PVAR5_4696 [Paecilomyces variotii No. 5]
MATAAELPKAQFRSPLRLGNKDDGLAYYIFNPEGTESVLFLHGAMTGAPDWDAVIPHFSKQYHLIVPDVPFHNNSMDMKLDNPAVDTAGVLRDLIKNEGRQGQAHIVGLSMGSHIGRRLAVQCPEVVQTCFLSGYHSLNFDWMPWKNCLLYIIGAVEYVGSYIPKSWIDGIEPTTETTTPHTMEHLKKVWTIVVDEGLKDKSWRARTLVVAASKGGLIPTNDSIPEARKLALLGQQENPETTVVQNKGMRHAWNRQDPKTFAEATMCWIQNRPLPDGFEPI